MRQVIQPLVMRHQGKLLLRRHLSHRLVTMHTTRHRTQYLLVLQTLNGVENLPLIGRQVREIKGELHFQEGEEDPGLLGVCSPQRQVFLELEPLPRASHEVFCDDDGRRE